MLGLLLWHCKCIPGRFFEAGQTCPLVICADLNSQPRESVVHGGAEGAYVLATTGVLAADHPDHPATNTPAVAGVEGSIPRSVLCMPKIVDCTSGRERFYWVIDSPISLRLKIKAKFCTLFHDSESSAPQLTTLTTSGIMLRSVYAADLSSKEEEVCFSIRNRLRVLSFIEYFWFYGATWHPCLLTHCY